MASNASHVYYYQYEHLPRYGNGFAAPPWPYETHRLIGLTLAVGATGLISVSGLISNTINIIVFYRQGILSHSSIVSLTALAVSDLLMCILSAWKSICLLFDFGGFHNQSWRWDPVLFKLFICSRPMNVLATMTCFITAFATLERLISVVFPFKVKTLFTPKKSIVIIICTCIFIFLSELINLVEVIFYWSWDPEYNMTRLVVRGAPFMYNVPRAVSIFVTISRIAWRGSTITLVVVCNILIARKVRMSTQFRSQTPKPVNQQISASKSSSSTPGVPNISESADQSKQSTTTTTTTTTKEIKLVRMVTAVSTVFFICYIGELPSGICLYLIWKQDVDYHFAVEHTVYTINFLLATINSSANIIIYLAIGSNYRQEFCRLFRMKQSGKQI